MGHYDDCYESEAKNPRKFAVGPGVPIGTKLKIKLPKNKASKKPKNKKKINGFAPGSYGCHEVMHMVYVMSEQFEKEVCNHSAVLIKLKWQNLSLEISEKLYELYSMIEKEHMNKENE